MQSSDDDVPADAQPIQVSRLQKRKPLSQRLSIVSRMQKRKPLSQRLSPAALRAQNLRSPVGRLPPEIILLIFEHFVTQNEGHVWVLSTVLGQLGRTGALLRLCKVCSRWRNICVDTPMLWKYLDFHRTQFALCERYGEVISDILSRSAPLPIRLWVETTSFMFSLRSGAVMLDFELLRNVCNRLEGVTLCLQDADVAQCAPPDGGLPLLSSLTIDVGYKVPSGLLARLADFFADSPSLRTLHLKRLSNTSNLQIPDFPWAKLTSLTLSVLMDHVNLYRILKACPLLQRCALWHVIDCSGESDPPPLTMPALHHLNLRPGGLSIGFILEYLNLPKLRSLRLASPRDVRFDPVDWLIQCHERAPFPLHDLVLEGLDTQTTDLVRLFSRLARTLESLELVQMSRSMLELDGILPFFTCDPSAPEQALALPNLRELKFCYDPDRRGEIDGDALVDMAESLWVAAASNARFPSLCRVDLDLGCSEFDEEVEGALARLIEESNGFIRGI